MIGITTSGEQQVNGLRLRDAARLRTDRRLSITA